MAAGQFDLSVVWLRRDLRLDDNVALYEAVRASRAVCIAFVVNPPLLHSERMGAPLVGVFFNALASLREDLRERGSDIALLFGDFEGELAKLAKRLGAQAVFYNEDYEPDAIRRDHTVTRALEGRGLVVRSFLDHVYFGANDVAQDDGSPYRVYTPFKRRWLSLREEAPRTPVPSARAAHAKLLPRARIGATREVPSPEEFGFSAAAGAVKAGEQRARRRLATFLASGGPVESYRERRDVPAVRGTSGLSAQLRAGTVGIRTCVEHAVAQRDELRGAARAGADVWISELIWRDFYQIVLRRFPLVVSRSFLEKAANIPWRRSPSDFEAWCAGATGYPIVDAAMRQLNATGWMHNRLRMVVASFLTKHLLIDWREGERYFEQHLADADVAANNGGWQWAASTGTDAAPYFRIFNPTLQGRRFDPGGTFVRRLIPELASVPGAYIHAPWEMPPLVQAECGVTIGEQYPAPLVDHAEGRARALAAYASLAARRGAP